MRPSWSAWATPVLVSLVLLMAAGPALAVEPKPPLSGIIGSDERQVIDTTSWPWSAIGRINIAGQDRKQHCTGTLVGPRHVLTAAHCLIHPQTRRIIPHAIHFLAGYSRGEYLAHSVGQQVICGAGTACQQNAGQIAPDWPLQQDWALIVLRDEIALEPIPLASSIAGTRTVTRAGYSRDRAHLLLAHSSCSLADVEKVKSLIRHECDGTYGDSGSPLLAGSGDNFRLVGLNVGYARAGGKTQGLALAADAFVAAVHILLP